MQPVIPSWTGHAARDALLLRAVELLAEHGCVLVKGLVDTAPLKYALETAYATQDRKPDDEDHYAKGIMRVDLVKRDAGLDMMTWAKVIPAYDLMDTFFLGRAVPDVISARRVKAGTIYDKGAGWHADGDPLNILRVSLNCWIPTRDCGPGTDAPGMAIYPSPASEMRDLFGFDPELVPADEWDRFGVRGCDRFFRNADWRQKHCQAISEKAWRPALARGDALIFTNWCLHATDHGSYTEERQSAEVRFQEGVRGTVDLFNPASVTEKARAYLASRKASDAPSGDQPSASPPPGTGAALNS